MFDGGGNSAGTVILLLVDVPAAIGEPTIADDVADVPSTWGVSAAVRNVVDVPATWGATTTTDDELDVPATWVEFTTEIIGGDTVEPLLRFSSRSLRISSRFWMRFSIWSRMLVSSDGRCGRWVCGACGACGAP